MSGVITSLDIRWSDQFVDSNGNKDESGLSENDPGGGKWFDFDTSTNDYGLRQANWGDGGYSGNVYEVREFFTGGTGSGFEATVRYRRFVLSNGAEKVKIRILQIHSYGTGYTVDDVLSTPTWNNWPGVAQRVLKVRGATPSASLTATPTSIQADSGTSSNLSWESTNGSTYSLTGDSSPGASGNKDVTPTTTTTYTYTVTSVDGDEASDTVTVTVTPPPPPPPPVVYLFFTPSIVRGDCATITYLSSGTDLTSASLTGFSDPGFNGSVEVCPTSTTTYTYTVCNPGGCTSESATITVIPPPSISLSATLNPIVSGTSTTLQWDTDGTVDSISWNAESGITNGNFTSSEVVYPSDTTTYTVTATATILGTVYTDVATVTIVVNQIPTINLFNVPEQVGYLTSPINIEYGFSYANISAELAVSFLYEGSTSYVLDTNYNITPISGGAQIASPNVSRSGNIDTFVTYNNQGPNRIQYVLTVTGSGGTITENKITTVTIDRTPDNIIIPETDDKLKGEEPVYSPDVLPNDIIQSDLLSIEGINVPVEIKSNRPIKVEVNQSGTFENVREL